MEFAFPILIFIIFLAVAAVVVYFAHLQQRQRREELGRLAESLGWRFVADRDRSHEREYAHFEIFRQGHSRFAYNTLSGSLEVHGHACPVKMGDYHYRITTSNGKQTTTHTYRFSYLIVHLPYAGLPDLLIRREGFFDRLAGFFGFPDINFESAEFSRRFHVKSPNKRFAYDVIHPRMMEYLLESDPPTIDIEHGRCCLAEGHKTWSPTEFQAKIDWLGGFFERWPEHLMSALVSK